MPIGLIVFIWQLVASIVKARVSKTREVKPQPLCADCAFAHIQYATKARRAVSCTFGGGVRPVPIDVLFCTDYRDRNVTVRPNPIGFVCNRSEVEGVAAAST